MAGPGPCMDSRPRRCHDPRMRIGYLDGLRGIAALMVLLSHVQQAFLPPELRPFGVLANGELAVFLFFLISGRVLTPSFAAGADRPARLLAARLVRLALPVAAAIATTLLLRLALPDARVAAAAMAGSSELVDYAPALRPGAMAADASGLTMLVGHAATGLFGPLVPLIPYLRGSLIPPLWSLHYEFWGSVLVLLLVLAARRGIWARGLSLAGGAALTAGNPLVLFLLGHAAGGWLARPGRPLLGAVLILAGLALANGQLAPWLAPVGEALTALSPLRTYGWFRWWEVLGATLIFLGLARLPLARRGLEGRVAQWLGRLSFSVYLLHWGVLQTLGALVFATAQPLGRWPAFWLGFAVVLAVTLALAEGLERAVDRPALALSRRLRGRG